MANQKLDQTLLQKVAKRSGRPADLQYVRNRLLRLARSKGISSPAALVVLARDMGIGYQAALSRLDEMQRAEVGSVSAIAPTGNTQGSSGISIKVPSSTKTGVGSFTQLVLADPVLRNRVRDLIAAPRNYDRPISEATKVLESRIRKRAKPPRGLSGSALVGFAFNEDIARTKLKLSEEPGEQRGYTQIIRGLVSAFRNSTHHDIVDTYSQEDALKVCAFIDLLLPVIDNAKTTDTSS